MSKIYEPKGKAREYSPLALNFYKGCTHGCLYCYVPSMFSRFRPNYVHSCCEPSLNERELENSCRKYDGCGKRVLMSFTGDPYCGVSPETTRKALEILSRYRIDVAILSKGGSRMLSDIDLFKKIEDIRLGVSLTFSNDRDSKYWESGAASPQERIETLRELKKLGFKTWASFEPVVIPKQSLELLSIVSENKLVDYVKIGKINHFKEIEKTIDWNKFLSDAISICEKNYIPYYIKDDLAKSAPNVILKKECRIADNF